MKKDPDPASDEYPLWTPDGQRVVFQSSRDGGGLFWKAAHGTGQVERLTTGLNQEPYSFSPDGKRLVFSETHRGTLWDIGLLSVEGEPTLKPLLQTQFREGRPAISPDGRWIAYMSDESARFEVYVRPFPNVEEAKWQISTGGGLSPLWGPEGRKLFYRAGEAMMIVKIETEPSFRASSPEALFTGRYVAAWGRNYDISPDGERFLMIKQAGETQLIVVLNWFEELSRLVPTGE